jgi:hypothetical protein
MQRRKIAKGLPNIKESDSRINIFLNSEVHEQEDSFFANGGLLIVWTKMVNLFLKKDLATMVKC